jgi:hypothetical protein
VCACPLGKWSVMSTVLAVTLYHKSLSGIGKEASPCKTRLLPTSVTKKCSCQMRLKRALMRAHPG